MPMPKFAFAAAASLLLLLPGCAQQEVNEDAPPVATNVAPSDENSAAPTAGMPVLPASQTMSPEELKRAGYSESEEKACRNAGGSYAPMGMLQQFGCAKPYADAGKICRASKDCSGQCIVSEEGGGGSAPAGEAVVGQCQASSNKFGCYSYIDDETGGVVGICID